MNNMSSQNRIRCLSAIAMFLILGVLIGAAAYWSFIPRGTVTILKAGMVAVTLAGWLALRRREALRPFALIAQGFFSVSLGVLLAQYLGNIPLRLSGFSATTVRGVAMAKLGETLPIVLSILGVHLATGGKPDGLFLQRGNLKLWLAAGVLGFAAFAGFGAVQAIGLGLSWETVAKALPWMALFVFCNAFMEELWFRALFLKKLQPITGEWSALVMTSLVFALVHISATYVLDVPIFLVGLLALGLLWGWLTQRSHSLWGSVLIHAGGDVLILLGFLAGGGG